MVLLVHVSLWYKSVQYKCEHEMNKKQMLLRNGGRYRSNVKKQWNYFIGTMATEIA